MKLLCISNGHGEDAIASLVLEQLRTLTTAPPEIVALPLVGVGKAYRDNGVPIVGTVQTLPSGGFNQDRRQFVRDLRGGLLGLTCAQAQTIRAWASAGGKILAVGDILPLGFAWWSGADYTFIGTAKSEYYLRDERGEILPSQRHSLEVMTGGYYFPWERWLLSRHRCKAIFARDHLTAEILRQQHIPAFDLGNPMADGVALGVNETQFQPSAPLTVTLMPGSRPPEAYANWEQIVIAVNSLIASQQHEILFLAAIDPKLELERLAGILQAQGWNKSDPPAAAIERATYYLRARATLILSTESYRQFSHAGNCAIAMAGTATEQFVSLGKPAFIIPGNGPQFTPAFAAAQTRLLGASVILVPQAANVGREIAQLFQQPDRLASIAKNGLLRMGTPGASQRIAACLLQVMT